MVTMKSSFPEAMWLGMMLFTLGAMGYVVLSKPIVIAIAAGFLVSVTALGYGAIAVGSAAKRVYSGLQSS